MGTSFFNFAKRVLIGKEHERIASLNPTMVCTVVFFSNSRYSYLSKKSHDGRVPCPSRAPMASGREPAAPRWSSRLSTRTRGFLHRGGPDRLGPAPGLPCAAPRLRVAASPRAPCAGDRRQATKPAATTATTETALMRDRPHGKPPVWLWKDKVAQFT